MMGCFSGHLMSSASSQKLFCEVCSVFKSSFEFVGEKVVSLSYSSTILAPPLDLFRRAEQTKETAGLRNSLVPGYWDPDLHVV